MHPAMKLHLGECLDMMKLIPDASVDAIICDPPFGTTQLAWDKPLDWEKMWIEYNRVTKPGAPIIIFAAQPFASKLIMSNLQQWRHTYYWIKSKASCHQLSATQPMKKVEEIAVFARARPDYHPPKVKRDKPYTHKLKSRLKSPCYGGAKFKGITDENPVVRYVEYATQTDVLEFKSLRESDRFMNTQKPLDLVEFFVKTYTNEGDVVLDSCLGSGTTGTACKNLNRRFIGIEKNPKHFLLAMQRIYGIGTLQNIRVEASPIRAASPDIQNIVQDNFHHIARARSHLSWGKIAEMLSKAAGMECNWLSLRNHFLAVENSNKMAA
jgi:site-specific DNA-methyltransferase (adenine-specific)